MTGHPESDNITGAKLVELLFKELCTGDGKTDHQVIQPSLFN